MRAPGLQDSRNPFKKNLQRRLLPAREHHTAPNVSTNIIAFVYHHVLTAAIGPNPDERLFALWMFSQLNRIIRIGHGLPVDRFNHLARLKSGLCRSRTRIHLGYQGPFDVVGDVVLLTGLLIQVGDGHAVERAVVSVVLRAVVGQVF